MKQTSNNESATKQDLKRLQENIDTKFTEQDDKFTKKLDASLKAFRNEINHMFQVQDERWERRFTAFESRLITVINPLLKELDTRQQERAIAATQIKHVNDDITDLQKRVTKLETS
jgi:hypothetical protein